MKSDSHSLQTLLAELRAYLGPKDGIDSADIEVARLKELLDRYKPEEGEWLQYGKPDPSRGYTRLLIDDINGRCNLVSLLS